MALSFDLDTTAMLVCRGNLARTLAPMNTHLNADSLRFVQSGLSALIVCCQRMLTAQV